MIINPMKFYTITELMKLADEGFFPIENRHKIIEQIELGNLKAKNFGSGERPYWKISGQNVLAFFETGALPTKEIQNSNVKRTKRETQTKNEKSLQKVKRKIS